MKSKIALVLLAVSIGLIGCGEKEKGATPIIVDGGRTNVPTITAQSAGVLNYTGWVVSPGNQSAFEDSVAGFISRVAPESDLGYVAANASNGTGVYFGSKIEFDTGVALSTANIGSGTRYNVRSDSGVLLSVFDDYTGRTNSSGQQILPYAFWLTSASGYVQGNTAVITFSDGNGSVTFEGTFNNSLYSGVLKYNNSRRVGSSGSPVTGRMGNFEVPTCQFFRCQ